MAYDDPLWRTKPLQYAVFFLYSVVVAIIWLPAFGLRRIARFARESGVETWPRADGSITGGEVKVIHGWILDYAVGQLEYSYRVSGEYYAGNITRQYADEQTAWEFVDARRGRSAAIRYRDGKTETSVLREADQEFLWEPQPTPGFFIQLWRHWCDELRLEPRSARKDEEL
ncbi:MAG TPA: hypothetical protein VGS27_01530 [Candidatus Sulfotelmatobacter sp.]|nr:hypothetical protein [Candidatus Sulfotelmatobacter sp.]